MEFSKHWRLKTQRLEFATNIVRQNGNGPEIIEGFGNNLLQISKNGNGKSLKPITRMDIFRKENGYNEVATPASPIIVYQAPLETKV